ncbi:MULTISPECIES: 5-deoxy-glucuronate isomerase [Metabacillus]|uniref:5-deoxy-glucuronate isomerase n=1 Tax=Metabacillus endolithicus TaxID=1535204 RepID=A0ABW5C2Y2_9BACI|nr:5-deoxy-glucuronate isomerase [Metabacillus endolithicus]UPG61966.1 5-deoxy-glucuronate isomerase [Metabacillus endolithicus]
MSKLLRKPNKAEQELTVIHNVTTENSSLEYVEFKVVDLTPGAKYAEELDEKEVCIVAVTGRINVTDQEQTFRNLGTRESVFEQKPTDSVYISNNRSFEIEGVSKARVAICYSPSENQLPTKLIKASDIGIEHRGVQNNKRLVHNILPDSDPSANSLLVVEVFTESGNWSSYPPHKHDQDNLPYESFLEETYYHEMNPKQGFVFQRVYTDDRSIDETMTVEHGDVVIVPAGYHPVGVPDGYVSYYLNVMAGPKRTWKFHNDPDHEWILKSRQ